MKKYTLILVLVILFSSCASRSTFNTFYIENKHHSEFSASAPAFLANLFIPKNDTEMLKRLLKKVKHYKFMVFSEESNFLNQKFNRFIQSKKYIPVFRINQAGEEVKFYVLKSKNRIKEIVMKINSDDAVIVLDLKTNILESDFNNFAGEAVYKVTIN